ncbi:MAG: hypothetical protein RLY43_1992, partial [Bacteroidota bacterium]
KLFYCSELPTFCYAKVKPGNPFTRIWQESTQTVTVFPRDFYDAKSKFEVIYCNK